MRAKLARGRLLSLTCAVIMAAFIAVPAQGHAASSQLRATHCQRLVGKSKRVDGGTDYRFAGKDYVVTYHVHGGDPAPDSVCYNVSAAPLQFQGHSGYYVSSSSGTYSAESNLWKSPQHIYSTTCGTNPESISAWGGVENFTNNTLIQAGMVRWDIGGQTYSGAWWEKVDGTSDTGIVSSWPNTLFYDQSHQYQFIITIVGTNDINFKVYDLTPPQKTILSADVPVSGGTARFFGHAEAEQERIVYTGGDGSLRLTKYEAFTGSQGGGADLFSALQGKLNGTWVNFSTQTQTGFKMHDNTTNTDLDTPGSIVNNTFQTYRIPGTAGCGSNEKLIK